MSIASGNANERSAYLDGINARKEGRPKFSPHPFMTNLWSWWLAGWNDEDRGMS